MAANMVKIMAAKGACKLKDVPFGKQCFIAKYILTGGKEKYEEYKAKLIDEINDLNIPGMPKINELYPLNGAFVNLKYTMPSGKEEQLLDDKDVYLGNQVECEYNDESLVKCFGIVANMNFMLVSEYGPNGDNPELIIYKKR